MLDKLIPYPSSRMSQTNRLRLPQPRADGYSLLPDRTPSSSPPPPGPSVNDYFFQYPPSTHSRGNQPTKRQLLYSTVYALVLASVIVIIALKIVSNPPREETYQQWMTSKMASPDPFDQLGTAAGVGPVERSMWGLHELRGWSKQAFMAEKGLLQLDDGGQRYRLYHNDTSEGALEYFDGLLHFVRSMPSSVHPQLLTSLYAHLPPTLQESFPPLPHKMHTKLGPPSMISYKNIYQTDKSALKERSEAAEFSQKWREFNEVDGWEMVFMNDTQADAWVKRQFYGSAVGQTWKDLHRGVLKADLLRYLLILLQGGVYSDVDTRPIRPIEHWGANSVENLDISLTDGPDYQSKLSAHPSIIIGVEIDVDTEEYRWYWPRPIQICQWTLSGAPFHPIYLDAVKRVVNATDTVLDSGIEWDEEGYGKNATGHVVRKEDIVSVLEWSGPPVFSDSVMQYLRSRYRVSWHRLRGIRHPVRIGDVLLLPNTAFAPGTHTAGKSWHVQANVEHKFRGSWKTSEDVF